MNSLSRPRPDGLTPFTASALAAASAIACTEARPGASSADASGRADSVVAESLYGRVVDGESGEPVQGIEVHVYSARYAEAMEGGPPATSFRRLTLAHSTSDDVGNFDAGLLPGGTTDGRVLMTGVSTDMVGYVEWSFDRSTPVCEDAERRVSLPVNPRGFSLDVMALNSQGEIVPGAWVSVIPDWEPWGTIEVGRFWNSVEVPEFLKSAGLAVVTSDDGIARFRSIPFLRDHPDECVYAVSAFDDRHVSELSHIELHDRELCTLKLQVERLVDLTLAGIVAGEASAAVGSGTVLVRGRVVATIEAGGHWTVQGRDLGARPWRISFAAEGFEHQAFDLNGSQLFRATREPLVFELRREASPVVR